MKFTCILILLFLSNSLLSFTLCNDTRNLEAILEVVTGSEDSDKDKETDPNSNENTTRKPKTCGKLERNKNPLTIEDYNKRRKMRLELEKNYTFGGQLELNKKEERVNEILMYYKGKEFDQGVETNQDQILFPASLHIYHAKKYIVNSNVYKIIQKFPKGALLHLHDLQSGPMDYVAKNLTRELPHLHACWDDKAVLQFVFTKNGNTSANPAKCVGDWEPIDAFRKNSSSEDFLDQIIYNKLTLVTDSPEIDYTNNNAAWRKFLDTISTSGGILGYEKATRLYFRELIQQFYNDNVQYLEVRSLLQFFYRLDQSPLSSEEVLELFRDVTKEFIASHPDFWGVRIIYSPTRRLNRPQMEIKLEDAVSLKKKFPQFLAGFDMAYHEDKGHPLNFYIAQLINASNYGLPFFFHAGETDWHGTRIDDNLLDAVILNATRIGHGTALNSRPYIVDIIREREIGLEVNPISSQVLKLSSEDLRTHPTIPFFKKGFPMVISSDDAGSLGTQNLSFDWYMAFMAMAGKRADIRFLKQLALNSIKFSAMCSDEKRDAMKKWRVKWDKFLVETIATYPHIPPKKQF